MKFFLLMLFSFFNLLFAAKKNTALLAIKFQPAIQSSSLQLNNKAYFNNHNDSFFVDEFKCYVGQFIFYDEQKNEKWADETYHLLNAKENESLNTAFKNVALEKISSIEFCVGVDSAKSLSGALDGDLDPTLGMYWAWNSGYINAKIEGHSSVCKTIHHAFEFHIGGYKYPFSTLRKVKLKLKTPLISNEKNLLKIKIDLAEILNNIDFTNTNSIVEPGKDAAKMANDFPKMFSVNE